jgi:hypothetical protein
MTLARTFSNRPIHRRWVIPLINQTKCTNNTIQKLLHNLSRPVTVRGATDQKENGLSRRKSTSRVQCCTTNPSSESLHSSKQLIQCPQTISPCRMNVSFLKTLVTIRAVCQIPGPCKCMLSWTKQCHLDVQCLKSRNFFTCFLELL